jgi:LacI family transcriptional regulator
MKRATINNVAERAGVSRAAVSKVLRDAYGISNDMRRRVEAAMAELDYRPQTAARGLRGRTYTLGILIPDIRNPFFPDILDGVVSELQATRYQPFLGVSQAEVPNERGLVDAMLDRKMDGLIIIAPRLDSDYLERMAKDIPIVMIGRHQHERGFDTVNNDDELGGRMVVDHLANLGHKRIAHYSHEVVELGLVTPNARRLKGYEERMNALGLGQYIHIRKGRDTSYRDSIALDMLQRQYRPSAIFAWTDNIALGVMSAANELGMRVPDELSVVGYDNSRICDLAQIALTSVDQSAHLLGETSARLLIERIEGRTDEVHFMVPPKLVLRHSTASPLA